MRPAVLSCFRTYLSAVAMAVFLWVLECPVLYGFTTPSEVVTLQFFVVFAALDVAVSVFTALEKYGNFFAIIMYAFTAVVVFTRQLYIVRYQHVFHPGLLLAMLVVPTTLSILVAACNFLVIGRRFMFY